MTKVDMEMVQAVMATPVKGTNLVAVELFDIGRLLLNMVGTTSQLGHTSPAHSLEYVHSGGYRPQEIVLDYTAWAGNRLTLRPGADERLLDFVHGSGWHARQLAEAFRMFDEVAS